ncbi:DUF1294 domain-containing protein [Desulfocicer niacini]
MNSQVGIISNWNDEKGFGFITSKTCGNSIFIHINEYSKKHKRPTNGLNVQYSVSKDNKGRKCAVNVYPVEGHKKNNTLIKEKTFATFFTLSFTCILYFLHRSKFMAIEVIYLYSFMSLVAFLMYAKDKKAAKFDKWRTAESTLHLVALTGGWPGAAIAQSYLRHKSKKISFKIKYWITIAINCSVLWWVNTHQGKLWFDSMIEELKYAIGNVLGEHSYLLSSSSLHDIFLNLKKALNL